MVTSRDNPAESHDVAAWLSAGEIDLVNCQPNHYNNFFDKEWKPDDIVKAN
jgi:hypothetical protein